MIQLQNDPYDPDHLIFGIFVSVILNQKYLFWFKINPRKNVGPICRKKETICILYIYKTTGVC